MSCFRNRAGARVDGSYGGGLKQPALFFGERYESGLKRVASRVGECCGDGFLTGASHAGESAGLPARAENGCGNLDGFVPGKPPLAY